MKRKYKIIILTSIIGLFGTISAAFINKRQESVLLPAPASEIQPITTINIDGGITAINGDNGNIQNGDTVNNNNTTIITTLDYNFEKTEEQLLLMANNACINQQYDYAYDVYTCGKLDNNSLALINLGYIYAKGISYVGENYDKAESCFLQADCVEAKRNLLALYLRNQNRNRAEDVLIDLLWNSDDEITWNYISGCLFDKTFVDYAEENNINKLEFELDLEKMFEMEETDNTCRGYHGFNDRDVSIWLPVGVDFNENYDPYTIWRLYIKKFYKNMDIIESMYYEENGEYYYLKVV